MSAHRDDFMDPQLHALADAHAWPVSDWADAHLMIREGLSHEEHRQALWDAVVSCAPYTRPTRMAEALLGLL